MGDFNSDSNNVRRIRLVSEQSGRVKDLKGFRKSHKPPTEITDQTRAFVSRIAVDDIQDDLDDQFRAFRRHLGFRRVEMTVDEPTNGEARIVTPWFDYSISFQQNSEDSQETTCRRVVTEFRQPDRILTSEFSTVFGSTFRTIELELTTPLSLDEFIDRVEGQDDTTVTIDYDRHATWCTVCITEVPGQLFLTADNISLTVHQQVPPEVLLRSFFSFCNQIPGIELA